jgi:hypothetical protein
MAEPLIRHEVPIQLFGFSAVDYQGAISRALTKNVKTYRKAQKRKNPPVLGWARDRRAAN